MPHTDSTQANSRNGQNSGGADQLSAGSWGRKRTSFEGQERNGNAVHAGFAGLPHSGRTALAVTVCKSCLSRTAGALEALALHFCKQFQATLAPHPHQHLVWSPSLNLVISAILYEYSDLVCTPVINSDAEYFVVCALTI